MAEESLSNFVAMTNLVRSIDKKREEAAKIASERDAARAKLEAEKKQLEEEMPELEARLKEMETQLATKGARSPVVSNSAPKPDNTQSVAKPKVITKT